MLRNGILLPVHCILYTVASAIVKNSANISPSTERIHVRIDCLMVHPWKNQAQRWCRMVGRRTGSPFASIFIPPTIPYGCSSRIWSTRWGIIGDAYSSELGLHELPRRSRRGNTYHRRVPLVNRFPFLLSESPPSGISALHRLHVNSGS